MKCDLPTTRDKEALGRRVRKSALRGPQAAARASAAFRPGFTRMKDRCANCELAPAVSATPSLRKMRRLLSRTIYGKLEHIGSGVVPDRIKVVPLLAHALMRAVRKNELFLVCQRFNQP